jgi:hypothetical protein
MHTDQGWETGTVEEHGKDHGEGSQTPPARDEDGNLLPMKEAASGVAQVEIRPLKEDQNEQVRVSIYESSGKLHRDMKLTGLYKHLTLDLLMPKRLARHIAGLLSNMAHVRLERRGDPMSPTSWGKPQVIRK